MLMTGNGNKLYELENEIKLLEIEKNNLIKNIENKNILLDKKEKELKFLEDKIFSHFYEIEKKLDKIEFYINKQQKDVYD